jgi:hypothetical protein
MASTYLSLHYHLVFATKHREAVIAPEWRSRLHEYLGGSNPDRHRAAIQLNPNYTHGAPGSR